MFFSNAEVFRKTPDKKKLYGPVLAIDSNMPWFWVTGPKRSEFKSGLPGGLLLIADIHTLKDAVTKLSIDSVRANLPSLNNSFGPTETRVKRVLIGTYRHGKELSEVIKIVMKDDRVAYYDKKNACSNYEELKFTDFITLH